MSKLNALAAPLLAAPSPKLVLDKKPKLKARMLSVTPQIDGIQSTSIPFQSPFEIDFQCVPCAQPADGKPSDPGTASQAAAATANAAAAAVERGGSVNDVVESANVIVEAYDLVRNSVGAKAARAVAKAAGARRNITTSSPQDVADAARTWADAIKAAEGQSVASKASDSTPTIDSEVDLPKDLPPPSAKAAFESALPTGTSPALSAAGDYEYSLFAATRDRPEFSEVRPRSPAPPSRDPPPRRRIGFFAVKYETPNQSWLAERNAWVAAWTGARAVQSQLVSLSNPGLGHSVYLRKNESLVVGSCSFYDDGESPEYDWFAFERDVYERQRWYAYTITPRPSDLQDEDRVEDAPIESFTDARVPLGLKNQTLRSYPPSAATLLHVHRYGKVGQSRVLPAIRLVISGDVLTFSIEVGMKDFDSFHLAGQYQRDFFPVPERGSRSAFEERLQMAPSNFGARLPLRGKLSIGPPSTARTCCAARESLVGPDDLRRERLGDDNHLVLFVRDSRTGQSSWLGLSSGSPNGLQITTKLAQPKQEVQRKVLDYSLPSSPGLASPLTPKGEPAYSYPLFLGGEGGSRLIEVWIVQNQRTEGHFAGSPTPLFDVQYLFLRPQ